MSKLDQPLKVKHGLAAAVAIMAVSITGTAIAGGAGQKDAIRASAARANLHGKLHYRSAIIRNVQANDQFGDFARCPRGTKVVGGGVSSSAGFRSGGGTMINTSAPFDNADSNPIFDDGWLGRVDAFANAGDPPARIRVTAICVD